VTTTTTTATLITPFLDRPYPANFLCNKTSASNSKYGTKTPSTNTRLLRKIRSSKHLVYFVPPITTPTSRQSFSLTQIIHTMSSKPHADNFCKSTSTAASETTRLSGPAIPRHSMLKDSWAQRRRCLFPAQMRRLLPSHHPHLNVQLGKSNGRHPQLKSSAGKRTSNSNTYYPPLNLRNPYLFGWASSSLNWLAKSPFKHVAREA